MKSANCINRGDIVAYWKEPGIPLKVVSDQYEFNGQWCVTARKVARKKSERQHGMYCVNALVPYRKQEE